MRSGSLLVLCVLLSMGSWAQKKHFYTLTFSKDFPKHYHVIGGHLTMNKEIRSDFNLGGGFAVTKFDNIEKLYFPLYANFSYTPGRKVKKLFPVFFLQPGYGFYHREEGGVTTKGGFTFHASGGIGYPFLWKTKGYASFGIGHYGFRGADTDKTSYGGRIGMIF